VPLRGQPACTEKAVAKRTNGKKGGSESKKPDRKIHLHDVALGFMSQKPASKIIEPQGSDESEQTEQDRIAEHLAVQQATVAAAAGDPEAQAFLGQPVTAGSPEAAPAATSTAPAPAPAAVSSVASGEAPAIQPATAPTPGPASAKVKKAPRKEKAAKPAKTPLTEALACTHSLRCRCGPANPATGRRERCLNQPEPVKVEQPKVEAPKP
jgi:hypothetical protein